MTVDNQARIGVLLLVCAVAGPLLLSPAEYPLSTRVAAIGGLVAFVGVLAIGRPVWRVGVYQWIANNAYSKVDPRFLRDAPKPDDPKEAGDDAAFQNVFGPMLVGMGTLINGFSGYFH